MRDQLLFLKTFVQRPTQVGAIWPSSRGLSEMLVNSIDWSTAKCVVEFGPGTGVATQVIADKLTPAIKFFAIERSPELAAKTRSRCPRVEVIEGCVTEVEKHCQERGIDKIDGVISGLPWASFSSELQDSIFAAMFRVLPPGGHFATFAYLQGVMLPAGKRFYDLLQKNFSSVTKSPVVWLNMPPAFVYRCVR